MQGEVTVPYTSIGGQNMDSGIMPADIGGSVNQNTSGTGHLSVTVLWHLPGGIQSKDNEPGGSGWGYILGRDYQDTYWTTSEFCNYLTQELGVKFDEQGNLVEGDIATVTAKINDLIYQYVLNVQRLSGYEPDYDWARFNSYYGTCLIWPQ
ncbi:hypothetical protein [Thomasclavelia saccharogumia]|uniref:hypothetical protein n=1 Tax=Thomasclavelia saccharogumia TaxID=341225 RepID=UPI00047ED62D|nr:hypothetical protein [Thomasclavelia saccharogumia]